MTAANSKGAQLALPIDTKPRPAWAPSSDSEASLEAAAHVFRTGRAARVLAQVFAALASEPATDQELEQRLNVAGNTIRPRRGELVHNGLAEHSGEYRKATSGRRAKVYRLTPTGRALFDRMGTKGASHG